MSESKFTEFWLDPLLSPRNSIYTESSESCIHVIEISAIKHYERKIADLESIIACKLNENDEFGCEFVITKILNNKISARDARISELEDALKYIADEPSMNHWYSNDDGTKTNRWPSWSRKVANRILKKVDDSRIKK